MSLQGRSYGFHFHHETLRLITTHERGGCCNWLFRLLVLVYFFWSLHPRKRGYDWPRHGKTNLKESSSCQQLLVSPRFLLLPRALVGWSDCFWFWNSLTTRKALHYKDKDKDKDKLLSIIGGLLEWSFLRKEASKPWCCTSSSCSTQPF